MKHVTSKQVKVTDHDDSVLFFFSIIFKGYSRHHGLSRHDEQ